jgi:serine-type D-Ala-D-Ala carboxypeptidase (penicillin-binding protein 5/6)
MLEGLMRIAGRLAACAVAAGMIVAGGTTAAAARAAVPAARIPGTTSVAGAVPVVKAASAARATRAPGPAGVRSPWAELAVASTGADLWSRSSAVMRPMGSITKVMTAYVVLQLPRLKLSRVITVPTGIIAYDTKYDASTAGLRPGEKLTTLQLLYAMLLPSGCDAAYTLADAYGPGPKGFIARMNATARKLGLTKTHFADFSGLPVGGEYTTYSTAHDLVNLGRAAMKLKTFAAIVATRVYKVAATSGHDAHVWKNLDPLLGKYPGAIGIKTGFTNAAGECLLFEARRGSKTLIGVVLHSSSDVSSLKAAASDAAAILNWGFGRK